MNKQAKTVNLNSDICTAFCQFQQAISIVRCLLNVSENSSEKVLSSRRNFFYHLEFSMSAADKILAYLNKHELNSVEFFRLFEVDKMLWQIETLIQIHLDVEDRLNSKRVSLDSDQVNSMFGVHSLVFETAEIIDRFVLGEHEEAA